MSDQNQNPAATALGAAPATATTANPAPTTAQAADSWTTAIQNEQVRTWATAKGWKDVGSAIESGYHLEKLMGHDKAGRTVVLPGENATPEEIRAFQAKLGVPEKADGYKPHIKVPEGGDPKFAEAAANWFHKTGIPPKQAEALVNEWNGYMAEANKSYLEQKAVESEKAFGEVTLGWGEDADQNLELAKRATAQFIPAKDPQERQQLLGKIEDAIGTKAMLEMFANIGRNLGEGRMISSGSSGSHGVSVAEAQAKKTQLMNDPEWVADYATNKNKQAEMWKLTQIISGVNA